MKIYGNSFFSFVQFFLLTFFHHLFLGRLGIVSTILKKSIISKPVFLISRNSFVCLFVRIVSIYRTPFSTAFKKTRVFFNHFVGSYSFSINSHPKSEVLSSVERTGWVELPCISGYAQFAFYKTIGFRKNKQLVF